jgi:type I restriction enzyme R subunit
MTRLERAGIVREYYLKQLDDNEKEFVKFVLKTYETEGENELSLENLSTLVRLKYHTMKDAVARLGRAEEIVEDYLELQRELYVTVDS